jgi:hypothetical protein
MIRDMVKGARSKIASRNMAIQKTADSSFTHAPHARTYVRTQAHTHRLSHTDTYLWGVNVRPRKGANDAAMPPSSSTTSMVLLLGRKLSTGCLCDGNVEVVVSGLVPVVRCTCAACEKGMKQSVGPLHGLNFVFRT